MGDIKLFMFNTAILLAAGKSKRLKGKIIKQFLMLKERYVVAYSLEVLLASLYIQHIILVVPKTWKGFVKEKIIKKYNLPDKRIQIIQGGRKRQDSTYQAIKKIPNKTQIVLIHDGARPFITKEMVALSINNARKYGACIFALPATNTIKMSKDGNIVKKTLERNKLWEVQTPQSFRYDLVKKAFEYAYKHNWYGTDTSSLIEHIGGKVRIILGRHRNIKITTPEDLVLAEEFIKDDSRHRLRYS